MTAAIGAGAIAARAAGADDLALQWIPSWGAELRLSLDGYSFLYLLLVSVVGLAVVVYSLWYLPAAIGEERAAGPDATRYYALLALFAVAMAGLATATDLLLLFFFWEATTIASYFLIAFDRDREGAASSAALTTVALNGAATVPMLAGIVILWAHWDTFSLELLLTGAAEDTLTGVAVALVVVAALAKSAQAPLHLWLPRAMVAPTPVSAYLHSAAMVAAGVLLLGRMLPLVELSPLLGEVLIGLGALSIALGGLLALGSDGLKRILAYSTISQYGYVVVLYGIGGASAAVAASLYVVGHAIEKSALFLTAGAVRESTGTESLRELGGLARRLPLLAAASAAATAALAGLPLTLGFFQDELVFKAAAERGTWAAVAFAAAAALTVAYLGRFWLGVFGGPGPGEGRPLGAAMQMPVAALAAIVVVGGIAVGPFLALAEGAAAFSMQRPVHVSASYELAASSANAMALGAFAVGALLLALARRWPAAPRRLARVGRSWGPAACWDGLVRATEVASHRLYDLELRDLRTRVGAVLVPATAFGAAGLLLPGASGGFAVGSVSGDDAVLLAALALVSLAALALTGCRSHLSLVLLLSLVGYGLATTYALFGAPDVALVAVLVETTLALVFFGVLSLMPSRVLRRESRVSVRRSAWRDRLIAVGAGAFAAAVLWAGLSQPFGGAAVGLMYPSRVGDAHSGDAVTAILADFRALDTLGEVTVLMVALFGVIGLLKRRRDS